MPARHLTPTRPPTPPNKMAEAVLAVLSGTPAEVAAAAINARAETLAEAVEAFQTAGYQALEARTADHGWYSVRVQFADWESAEQAAVADLGPRLDRLCDRKMISEWWFIRKHPCWRLRLRPLGELVPEVKAAVNTTLNELAVSGVLSRWWPAIYEPEDASFGGPVGTEIAHALFCADSHRILTYLRTPPPDIGRKEMSILLCATLLSAAGLDVFERGNVWNSIAALRPVPIDAPPDRLKNLAEQIRPLVAARAGSVALDGQAAAFITPWTAVFRDAGQSLGEAATAGHLDRGIRHILTHLVIFHWNRLGLPATTQGILSSAARQALLPSGK
ncbi:thiopeptide-type bacteriocin biosynthesis protein [Nonomuraea sp. NPDC046802]|uniref:thiopeptide-type bacteriocin biosynthesis protein n=1 Tax=Nonomuraea sp. NPDC046802 TaxID=3154919 RepID=UPI0033DC0597